MANGDNDNEQTYPRTRTFAAALSIAIPYASLSFPVDEGWTRYNGLQQFSYSIMVFVAAPVSTFTGLMQGPAIFNALGWFGRLFTRQAMRSVHFISFAWFVGFILAHGATVSVIGLRQNTNHMFGGVASWTDFTTRTTNRSRRLSKRVVGHIRLWSNRGTAI
jgi:thiosulfate reductase cytochrome b subunit